MGPKNGHSNGRHTTKSPNPLVPGNYGNRDCGGANHETLSTSPRRRPRSGTPPESAIPTDSPQTNGGPSYTGNKNIRRRTFLVCASGLAWAFLIVRVLGPSVSPTAARPQTSPIDGEP